MDKQLKALAEITEKANEETAEMAEKYSREGMEKMIKDLECSPPEQYEVKYQSCGERNCCRKDQGCRREFCERKCEERSYTIHPRCNRLDWFMDKMDPERFLRGRNYTYLQACGCKAIPVTFDGNAKKIPVDHPDAEFAAQKLREHVAATLY